MAGKKIVIYSSHIRPDGVPAYERKKAFGDYFEKKGFTLDRKLYPVTLTGKLRALVDIVAKREIVFVSMPPFRYWFLIFFPFTRTILDLRDGWSIAMESGYGGTSKPKPFMAKLARFMEKYAIKKSILTITCTPGLQQYLEAISRNKVLLIPNSFSDSDVILASVAADNDNCSRVRDQHNFVRGICVGKFSEYGVENVKKFLYCVSNHFSNSKYELTIVAADEAANSWITDWLSDNNIQNVRIKFLPRVSRSDLYKLIIEHDHGVSIIRDPDYDFGTKVFDYIACGKPIFNYFKNHNNFTLYFDGYLTHNNPGILKQKIDTREHLVRKLDAYTEILR